MFRLDVGARVCIARYGYTADHPGQISPRKGRKLYSNSCEGRLSSYKGLILKIVVLTPKLIIHHFIIIYINLFNIIC